MRVIDLIDNDKKDIKWIVEQFKKDLLYVDNSFQRRYVWLEKHQIKLIETILMGYAIPEIYLWITNIDPSSGETYYSIIDGQQRIGAIVDYINGKFKLKSTYLEAGNTNSDFANKKFSELSDSNKRLLWGYRFSMRLVKQEVQREDIVKLFLRLNSTDKSLNPQELRNAEFNGKFLNVANEISQFSFWKDNKIFSMNDLRRMGDIDFIGTLLVFLRFGIENETNQKAINKAYDMFNVEYDEAEEDKETISNILDEVSKIITDSSLKLLRKTTHLYTFIVVAYAAIIKQGGFKEKNIERAREFFESYDKTDSGELINRYKKLVLEGTQAKANRMERIDILSNILGI